MLDMSWEGGATHPRKLLRRAGLHIFSAQKEEVKGYYIQNPIG